MIEHVFLIFFSLMFFLFLLQVPNSMPLLTVEKKSERKNGPVNETFVLPKTEAKGQLISKELFCVFKSTNKKPTNFLRISALAFKKRLNQNELRHFVMLNFP